MQKLILVIACIATLCSCGNNDKTSGKTPGDSTFVLSGTIDGLDSGWIYLFNIQKDQEVPDSAKIEKGKFEFKGAAAEPQFAVLTFDEASQQKPLSFFLESGKIQVTASKDSLFKGKVSGSATQDEYQKFYTSYEIIDNKQRELYMKYQQASMSGDVNTAEQVRKDFEALEKENKDLVVKFAKENPGSYAAPFLIAQNFLAEPDAAELQPLYNGLKENIKASHFGTVIKKALDASQSTAIGSTAPNFTLTDINGKQVSLASYKGKYILLDFWASWCGPCRQENPAVVKAYNAYKSKGFDILGVSLDQKKEAWEQAIQEDQLSWTHVSDLKGWQSDVASLYGVRAIPMNYLLDKEGKIIAKSLRGEDLMKKLGEVLY
ncbi:MAG: redoxin domain-containing protein [Agriterribacter sp.]